MIFITAQGGMTTNTILIINDTILNNTAPMILPNTGIGSNATRKEASTTVGVTQIMPTLIM